jgi:hypothetical protein
MQQPALFQEYRPVLIVLNNKIIGKCVTTFIEDKKFSVIERFSDCTDITVQRLLIQVVRLRMSVVRSLLVKFDSVTGEYITCYSKSNITDELNSAFKDIRLVDEETLKFGLSPDFFRNVPGFGEKAYTF